VSDDRNPSNEPGERPSGVFAKLPDSRPGPRSPRRAGAGRAAKPKPTATAASARKRSATTAKRRRAAQATSSAGQARERPAPSPTPAAEHWQGGGIEDVAWAGIAAAAEAATIGVRLANRAIEALRGNPGER
jgi:hypothetical protein